MTERRIKERQTEESIQLIYRRNKKKCPARAGFFVAEKTESNRKKLTEKMTHLERKNKEK